MKSFQTLTEALHTRQNKSFIQAFDYLEENLDDDGPDILESYFLLLAEKHFVNHFKNNRAIFNALSIKLEYDNTKLLVLLDDPSETDLLHLFFLLIKDFTEVDPKSLLNPLKSKLK